MCSIWMWFSAANDWIIHFICVYSVEVTCHLTHTKLCVITIFTCSQLNRRMMTSHISLSPSPSLLSVCVCVFFSRLLLLQQFTSHHIMHFKILRNSNQAQLYGWNLFVFFFHFLHIWKSKTKTMSYHIHHNTNYYLLLLLISRGKKICHVNENK